MVKAAASQGSVEDVFALIERGNAMSACSNGWSAADAFGQASVVLREHADRARAEAQTQLDGTVDGNKVADKKQFHKRVKMAVERDRIATLYGDQSREYLYKARESLLGALRFENVEDQRRAREALEQQKRDSSAKIDPKLLQAQLDPLIQMISDEEAERRRKIFARIFALPIMDVAENEVVQGSSMEGVPDTELVAGELKEVKHESKQEEEVQEVVVVEEGEVKKETDATDALTEEDKVEVDLEIPAAPVSNDSAAKAKGDGNENDKVDEKQVSLEERFATLESSIPSELKSEKERMSDIHKGMGRLGLNLPTSPDIARHTIHAKPPSQEEQLKLIIEQAKDEARLEGHNVDNIPSEAEGSGEGDDIIAIKDEDDLANILKKAHLDLSGDRPRPSIAEAFKDSFKTAGAAKDLADRSSLLNLISTVQELLFEASACLEDADDSSGEEEDEEGIGLERDAPLEENNLLKRGKASVVDAKKCMDKILKSWPSS